MSHPAVSVIIVSRGRAADLPLCLLGLAQLDYPEFEIVLVADADGLAAARKLPFFPAIKTQQFDEANISAARNLGIAMAAGEIIAFIDDDAVPEPSWLSYLVAGFCAPEIAATGGFVRGRNGISFQWKARSVDAFGFAAPMAVDETKPSTPTPPPGHAVKTEGTNMAFRRDALAQIGGFDPAFRFYLDETDVNMRLAKRGLKTAITPLAQVHHGYKASATRRADRAPLDLFEIGASQVVFLRKHAAPESHEQALTQMRDEQQARLNRFERRGQFSSQEAGKLMQSLEAGFDEGRSRTIGERAALPPSAAPLRAFTALFTHHKVLWGHRLRKRALTKQASALVKQGNRVSVFLLSFTARRWRASFQTPGIWVQRGGVFGKSEREKAAPKTLNLRKRLNLEVSRLNSFRNFQD